MPFGLKQDVNSGVLVELNSDFHPFFSLYKLRHVVFNDLVGFTLEAQCVSARCLKVPCESETSGRGAVTEKSLFLTVLRLRVSHQHGSFMTGKPTVSSVRSYSDIFSVKNLQTNKSNK